MSTQTLSRRRFALFANLAVAVLMVGALVWLLQHYWAYFHMGTAAGTGMYLVYVVIPSSLLLFSGIAVAVTLIAKRKGLRNGAAVALGTGCMAMMLVLLFAIEVWRTSDYPTESGEPVRVSAFLSDLFSL